MVDNSLSPQAERLFSLLQPHAYRVESQADDIRFLRPPASPLAIPPGYTGDPKGLLKITGGKAETAARLGRRVVDVAKKIGEVPLPTGSPVEEYVRTLSTSLRRQGDILKKQAAALQTYRDGLRGAGKLVGWDGVLKSQVDEVIPSVVRQHFDDVSHLARQVGAQLVDLTELRARADPARLLPSFIEKIPDHLARFPISSDFLTKLSKGIPVVGLAFFIGFSAYGLVRLTGGASVGDVLKNQGIDAVTSVTGLASSVGLLGGRYLADTAGV